MTTSPYHHTQPGHTLLLAMAAVVLVVLLLDPETTPPVARMAIPLGLAVLAGLFGWLTVTVDSEEVKAKFGLGLIWRRIPLEQIRSVRAVRNPWWYGFGLRLTPEGWMFNVAGRDAVQLFLEGGRRFRIGTDQPAEVRDAIRRAVEASGRQLEVGSKPAAPPHEQSR